MSPSHAKVCRCRWYAKKKDELVEPEGREEIHEMGRGWGVGPKSQHAKK